VRHILVSVSLLLAVPCGFPGVTEERDGIVASMALAPGMTVADVGAGDGRYSVVLARSVGPGGLVYATEVDRADIDKIATRAADEKLGNVKTVVGDQKSTGLPAECCDAILLRLVYHHFQDTAAMRRSLWNALRAGGRIAVIDVPPQKSWRHLDGVPERGGHGIPVDELIADMKKSGFEVVARDDDWPAEDDAYLVVFRRPRG
jgi:tRNA A58 N-methylase Trm61